MSYTKSIEVNRRTSGEIRMIKIIEVDASNHSCSKHIEVYYKGIKISGVITKITIDVNSYDDDAQEFLKDVGESK